MKAGVTPDTSVSPQVLSSLSISLFNSDEAIEDVLETLVRGRLSTRTLASSERAPSSTDPTKCACDL